AFALLGVLVGHGAGPVRIGLDPGVEAAARDHAHHFPDQVPGLAPLPHVQVDLHVQVGVAVLRQLLGELAGQPQAAGGLIVDALAKGPPHGLPLPGIVVPGRLAPPMHDERGDETAPPSGALRIRADDDRALGAGLLLNAGAQIRERLIKAPTPLAGADKDHGITGSQALSGHYTSKKAESQGTRWKGLPSSRPVRRRRGPPSTGGTGPAPGLPRGSGDRGPPGPGRGPPRPWARARPGS